MKIIIMGAGAIGSAVAADLAQREGVTAVRICDARARALQTVHDALNTHKVRSYQVDVRDYNVLKPILNTGDAVINCTTSDHSYRLASFCLKAGVHFCDLGGTPAIVDRVLSLKAEAEQRSVWLVPNNGLAPGLVNVLCLHGMEQFDSVDAAQVRVGDIPLNPQPPFNFRISWSAQKVVEDYTNPVVQIEQGLPSTCEPLTGLETIRFDEPFENLEAFHTSGGLSTLPHDLLGQIQTLDYKTIRWPGHRDQMRFLLSLGFGDDRTIDVRTHLTYRDVLVRRLRQRLGGDYADAVLVRIVLRGMKDGEPKTLVYELADTYDNDTGMTAMRRCTSIPVAVAAYLVASKQVPGGGAAPPEQAFPCDVFVDMVRESGLDIRSQWYDGHRSVRDLGQFEPSEGPAASSS